MTPSNKTSHMNKLPLILIVLLASCGYSYETDIKYDANDDRYEVKTYVWDRTFSNYEIVDSKYNWKVGEYIDTRVSINQLDSTIKAHQEFAETIIVNMKRADSAISHNR